jgi:hypothetical protein
MTVTLPSSTDLRLRTLAMRVHALGPKPLYELARELMGGADPLVTFERYGGLPAEFIRAYRGDQFPPNVFLLRSSL